MTIIPEDDTAPTGSDPSERMAAAGGRAEDSARRIVAAIQGALEGFVEALERYDVGNEANQAIHEAGEITRSAATEGKTLAQSPEMRQAGEHLRAAGAKTSEVASDLSSRAGERLHHATEGVRASAHDAKEAVATRAHDARETLGEAVESAKFAAYRAKEGVKVRGQAVAESGRRARSAPRAIGRELSEAWTSTKRGFFASLALMSAMVLVGLTAFIVLTIALIAGLALVIGYVPALFTVTLLYVIVAGICYAAAKSARMRAAREREERMLNAREEVRHVVRPVRDAFTRGRSGI